MPGLNTEAGLEQLQRDTFQYFLRMVNRENGLVADHSSPGSDASIAATGMALAAYLIGVERQFMTRAEAAELVLTMLRFFWKSPQGPESEATGYKGFYYHFLNMKTGRRAGRCELSLIDTAIFLAGILAAIEYFDHANEAEKEIRDLGEALYGRVDWHWSLNGQSTVSHGWTPEGGFLHYGWEGYSEAILLYALGLGSSSHPLPPESYRCWTATYQWENIYGWDFLYAGPLFIHQFSHLWIDFREIQDEFMREKGIDYFENSRRATYVQREYARRNPQGFLGYGPDCWGITAGDGPGNYALEVDGRRRQFFGYAARGVPFGPDDGTIVPRTVVASLPFAPEIVLPAIAHFNRAHSVTTNELGLKCSFNATFVDPVTGKQGWVSSGHFGIDQGPVVLMIENFRSEFLWSLMKESPYIREGLRRAGFRNGWLS